MCRNATFTEVVTNSTMSAIAELITVSANDYQGVLCIKSIKMQRISLIENRGKDRDREEESYVSV